MKTYSTIIVLILTLFCATSIASAQKDTMTNQKVIELTKQGWNASLIKTKITNSVGKFTTDMQALTQLKKEGVLDEVVEEMVKKTSVPEAAPVETDPLLVAFKKGGSGVYYQTTDGTVTKFQQNESSKADVVRGLAAISAVAKAKYVITVDHPESSTQFSTAPKFYLWISSDPDDRRKYDNLYFRAKEILTKELCIVKLDKKKKERELVVGKKSSLSSLSIIDDDDQVKGTTVKKLANGAFEIIPGEMKSGEYAFAYNGNDEAYRTGQKLYDFSIKK